MSEEMKPDLTHGEPAATRVTTPMWLFVLLLALLFLGGVYFDHHSGWFSAKVYAPYTSAEEVEQYQPRSGAAAMRAHGKQVYEMVCGVCHGNDGLGKPGQAPPLAGSEWVNTKGDNRLIHIPLEGLSGPITVKGQEMSFPSPMAAMGAALSDADLAAVLSYIRSAWGNQAGAVTPEEVKAVRAAIGAHPQPLTAEQLQTMPE